MSEVVWSVNILIGLGLIGVIFCVYYILTLDRNEEKATSSSSNCSSSSDE